MLVCLCCIHIHASKPRTNHKLMCWAWLLLCVLLSLTWWVCVFRVYPTHTQYVWGGVPSQHQKENKFNVFVLFILPGSWPIVGEVYVCYDLLVYALWILRKISLMILFIQKKERQVQQYTSLVQWEQGEREHSNFCCGNFFPNFHSKETLSGL